LIEPYFRQKNKNPRCDVINVGGYWVLFVGDSLALICMSIEAPNLHPLAGLVSVYGVANHTLGSFRCTRLEDGKNALRNMIGTLSKKNNKKSEITKRPNLVISELTR
jgi:hypothetical protein